MNFLKRQNYRDRRKMGSCLESVVGEGNSLERGTEKIVITRELFYNLSCDRGSMITHQNSSERTLKMGGLYYM